MIEKSYFFRNIDGELLAWSKAPDRKTLLLRGARQVGKSSAVNHLANSFKYFVEVNFDDKKNVHTFFEQSLSPQEICEQLALVYRTPIIPGETLLFFDEIQSCLPALSKLRYFYEQYPELHLIAAGSLLEFALEEIPSFGVGRIRSLFMFPFSFDEFLYALGDNMLVDAYRQATPQKPLQEPVHNQLIHRLKTFFIIGGMPEAVAQYAKTQDLLLSQNVLNDIIISLKNDFAKYKKRIPALRINEVFESVARQAEGKFVYEHAAVQASNAQVKQALDMLVMAGLVYPVVRSAANGIPLGAEINPKFQRFILLDIGLFQRVLNLDVAQILLDNHLQIINKGVIAEIFAGLELLKNSSCYNPISLYYWQREKRQGSAQIDFLIQRGESIIPIEVKSGTSGKMQSMNLFLKEKQLEYGVRTSLENFSQYDKIKVYPLYAIGNLMKK
ncbi:MAG: AAA family ATPase [Lentimicrobiaceae bacterium]|nr:AAA family ATPase [Lentimicrobiaceae bacterium]